MPVSILCLFCAIILYGLFGSPTPDNPGMIEIVLAVLLVLATMRGGLKRFMHVGAEGDDSTFIHSLHILFFVGLILPVVTGVLRGNDPMLIVRDILAFLFLCLPLFMADTIARDGRASRFFPALLIFAGTAFAARTLIPAFNIWIDGDELLYLSNSPLVLFAALYTTGLFWNRLQEATVAGYMKAGMFLVLVCLLLSAMLLDVQRATIAAVFLTVLALWLDALVRTPRRIVFPTILLAVLIYMAVPWLTEAGEAIYRKTSHVGLNMRTQEALAVFESLASDPVRFFFGTGWGGVVASPAVGLIEVNYTHSLLTTMFLKGGLVLLCLTGLVFLAALHQVFLIFQRDRAKGLAVFWPLIIPVFLYASHKSLDFGLLLLLIGVWSNDPARLRRPV